MKIIAALNETNNVTDVQVEVHENHYVNDEQAITDTATENNKQIQILNLDVKTNNVYSITLDVSENEGKTRFVCIPNQVKENGNIFIYDYSSKESFV